MSQNGTDFFTNKTRRALPDVADVEASKTSDEHDAWVQLLECLVREGLLSITEITSGDGSSRGMRILRRIYAWHLAARRNDK